MRDRRAVICPLDWADAIRGFSMGGISKSASSMKVIPRPELHTLEYVLHSADKVLCDSGALDDVDSAVLVLPLEYAEPIYSSMWPQPVLQVGEGNTARTVVLSTVFADSPDACLKALEYQPKPFQPKPSLPKLTGNAGLMRWNVTAQYGPMYVDTLNAWEAAGANVFHPGDYFKPDLLEALANMTGHWVYVGHAEVDRLRGYQHIVASDLTRILKRGPLDSTLWLTCNTLAHRADVLSLGMVWYLSGAVRLFLGAVGPTDTLENQHFCKLWLHALLAFKANKAAHTLADVVRQVFSSVGWVGVNGAGRAPLKLGQHYRMLGNPWVGL
ncbi:MAG: hypothetical protein QE278_12755 [Limnobacter sp.]|nr:hypothetical protein [Limnobacter sp.]